MSEALSEVEQDLVEFLAGRSGRAEEKVRAAYHSCKEGFLSNQETRAEVTGALFRTVSLFYDLASEGGLVRAYRYFAPFHLFRFVEEPLPRYVVRRSGLARLLASQVEKVPVVLDYGCGVAHLSYEIATLEPKAKFYLLDVDCVTLEFVTYRFFRKGIEHEVIPVTPENVYPEVPSHDICIAQEVFEHLLRPEVAFENIVRSLEPGGMLCANLANHERKGFHISPDLSKLRTLAARDFEQVEEFCYKRKG